MIRIGIGKGRPRSRPEKVDADSAYDNKNLRGYLKQRGIKANIPGNDRNRKNPKRGRPIRFNGESYKIRGSIERFFGWLKMGFRWIAISHERLNICFIGMINISCFLIYWKRIYS